MDVGWILDGWMNFWGLNQESMNQVPGKEECQRCITAEPQALRNRDWKAVKYMLKITLQP